MKSPSSSARWRWDHLAADMMPSNIEDTQADWPHSDYAVAAQVCSKLPEDLAKLRAICDDLESLVPLNSGWASIERIARASPQLFTSFRGLCWREVLALNDLPSEVWKALYRLGTAYRSETMDSATRRTAMILQLAARQKLKSSGGFFESAEVTEALESERRELLTRPYLPSFLAKALS